MILDLFVLLLIFPLYDGRNIFAGYARYKYLRQVYGKGYEMGYSFAHKLALEYLSGKEVSPLQYYYADYSVQPPCEFIFQSNLITEKYRYVPIYFIQRTAFYVEVFGFPSSPDNSDAPLIARFDPAYYEPSQVKELYWMGDPTEEISRQNEFSILVTNQIQEPHNSFVFRAMFYDLLTQEFQMISNVIIESSSALLTGFPIYFLNGLMNHRGKFSKLESKNAMKQSSHLHLKPFDFTLADLLLSYRTYIPPALSSFPSQRSSLNANNFVSEPEPPKEDHSSSIFAKDQSEVTVNDMKGNPVLESVEDHSAAQNDQKEEEFTTVRGSRKYKDSSAKESNIFQSHNHFSSLGLKDSEDPEPDAPEEEPKNESLNAETKIKKSKQKKKSNKGKQQRKVAETSSFDDHVFNLEVQPSEPQPQSGYYTVLVDSFNKIQPSLLDVEKIFNLCGEKIEECLTFERNRDIIKSPQEYTLGGLFPEVEALFDMLSFDDADIEPVIAKLRKISMRSLKFLKSFMKDIKKIMDPVISQLVEESQSTEEFNWTKDSEKLKIIISARNLAKSMIIFFECLNNHPNGVPIFSQCAQIRTTLSGNIELSTEQSNPEELLGIWKFVEHQILNEESIQSTKKALDKLKEAPRNNRDQKIQTEEFYLTLVAAGEDRYFEMVKYFCSKYKGMQKITCLKSSELIYDVKAVESRLNNEFIKQEVLVQDIRKCTTEENLFEGFQKTAREFSEWNVLDKCDNLTGDVNSLKRLQSRSLTSLPFSYTNIFSEVQSLVVECKRLRKVYDAILGSKGIMQLKRKLQTVK